MWLLRTLANLSLVTLLFSVSNIFAQDDADLSLENFEVPQAQPQLCFGFRDVSDPRALAVSDAMNLDLNVKARELSEQWVRQEPNSPGPHAVKLGDFSYS